MITKEQAMDMNNIEFHLYCPALTGNEKHYRYRRNGNTQTWKTRPDDFRIPVKYGLYEYGNMTQDNAVNFHLASECPKDTQNILDNESATSVPS
jgi:hypothetical protein